MKFLYLIKQPLVKRDFERFGIKFFLDKGHDITVLDLSHLIHPETPNDRFGVVQDSRSTLREIRNRKELKAEKETFAESDLVFVLIYSLGLSYSTYPILRIITKTGTPYLIMAPSFFPGAIQKYGRVSLLNSIRDCFIRLKKMDPLNSIVSRLPRQCLGIREADYIVYNGKISQGKNALVGGKTIPIYTHTMDYDVYLHHSKIKGETKNQAVFIDQFLPYHLDFVSYKIDGAIDPDLYYGRLRRLFDRIENHLNLKVVIASHPRSEYQRYEGVFGNRKIHYGDTIDQIAKSRLVLAHYSTAIGFAVLFRKPIMLLTTQELYKHHPSFKHRYEGYSEELDVPLKYFDNPEDMDFSGLLSVNDELYDEYIHKYLKSPGSPSKYLWNIVLDAVGA